MKRLCLIVSILMTVLLGLSAFAQAQEASYFFAPISGIVRAYAVSNDPVAAGWTVNIECVDTANNPIATCVITGPTGSSNGSAIVTGAAGNGDISLACDEQHNKVYVFYSDSQQTLQLQSFTVVPGGPQLSLSTNALHFGPVSQGGSVPNQTVTVSNVGTASLTLSSFSLTSGSGFSTVSGSTTCSNSQVLAANGGNCAIALNFASTATAGSFSETLSVQSADGSSGTVALDGTVQASVPTGTADLTLSSVTGTTGGGNYGQTVVIQYKVQNQGTGATTGSFIVQGWVSSGPYAGGEKLFENSFDPLVAGASVTSPSNQHTILNPPCAIHDTCYYYIVVNPNKAVPESNYTNNSYSREYYRGR